MSKKGTITTSDYLDFDKTLVKCVKLLKGEKNFTIPFLIIVGINSGLRISDLLLMKHKHLSGDYIELHEKKTGKYRRIKINENIKDAYNIFINKEGVINDADTFLFISQKGTVYNVRSINRIIKDILKPKSSDLNISTHTLRKTFGRRVFENNSESEKSLIYLSDIFNHSSISITRRYLGIRQEEISDIYINL